MSILDEIEARRKNGDLFLIEPSDDLRAYRVPTAERRTLYVSPSIYQFVYSDQPLAPETKGDFYEYIFEPFDVALELDHQFCLMARLDEASEEVWEIRIWDAATDWEPRKPQLRFFGRFAARNIFIALIGPVPRGSLTPPEYERMKTICTDEWRRLFTYEPVSEGDDIDAYLSNVHPV
jgi:hypothetical protein